jgi:hypothetical protein
MARTRKSRPTPKATRAGRPPKLRAGKKPPAGRKPARAPKIVKSPAPEPLDAFIEAAARMLALPVEPQWLAAIKANLEVNLRLGALVAEFVLPDEAEPAPIFTA